MYKLVPFCAEPMLESREKGEKKKGSIGSAQINAGLHTLCIYERFVLRVRLHYICAIIICILLLQLHIFDAINLCAVNTFIAHDGPLAALKFNPDGTMLATASKKGTVIRVYSVPQGARLFEFRRGMTRFENNPFIL